MSEKDVREDLKMSPGLQACGGGGIPVHQHNPSGRQGSANEWMDQWKGRNGKGIPGSLGQKLEGTDASLGD